jgi:hypothetical protein
VHVLFCTKLGVERLAKQIETDATPATPVDPKRDQVDESCRVLREMWDKADRAIDEQTGRSK